MARLRRGSPALIRGLNRAAVLALIGTQGPIARAEIARRLAKAGYDGIELSGFPPHVTPEKYAAPAARAELKRFLADLGLGISGYSADLGAINPTTAENHRAYVDHFKQLLELCAEIGSPMIRFDTGTAPGSISDDDYHTAFYRLADVWRECADAACHAGVLMAWEFEPGFIFNKPAEVFELHQRVGHPWFQILFDTAHAYMSAVAGARQHGKKQLLEGGVAEFLRLHGSIGAIHVVIPTVLSMDDTSTHVPIGRGTSVGFRPAARRPHINCGAPTSVSTPCVDRGG